MRSAPLLVALLCVTPAVGQNWYIPDAVIGGNCNVIPLGYQPNSVFYNAVYQTRVTAADLGGVPNLITGLGFGACGNGGTAHYDTLEIVMDHIPASQPLSLTFASNLTPAAVTVLSSNNYTWRVPGPNTWGEIGLQSLFVFNGVDDVVIQITSVNGTAPVQGMSQGTRQRVYWFGSSGPAPASGQSDGAALKMEVSMLMAKTSLHGVGCVGSNGTPNLTFSGSAQVGNTLSFNLTNGVPNGIALFFAGFTNAFPFPLDLSIIGMPGCYQYTDLTVSSALLLDPVGSGSFVLPIPAAAVGFLFYGQFAVLDPPANAFGFTNSNYGRVHTGN